MACFCFLIWHSPKIGARLMLLLLHCSVTIQFYTFSRACFNFETTETFDLSQFSSCFSPFQFFPYIIHCFSVLKHQKWGLVFSLFPEFVSILFRNNWKIGAWYFHFFQSLFQFCFETTETFALSQFSSCFSPFQFFPYIIHCFSVSKHQKWGLVFSLFPELVSILFQNNWNIWT